MEQDLCLLFENRCSDYRYSIFLTEKRFFPVKLQFRYLVYAKINNTSANEYPLIHDDVIKWKHFPRYWPLVRGIHRSPVKSPHKGQWRGALMFSLIYVWITVWENNREASDLRRYRANYDVIVMWQKVLQYAWFHGSSRQYISFIIIIWHLWNAIYILPCRRQFSGKM